MDLLWPSLKEAVEKIFEDCYLDSLVIDMMRGKH
jgi:hypothetical protein